MPGRETVPPDPDAVRMKDEGAKRPGTGAPGEDAASGPVGRHGEGAATGAGPASPGATGEQGTHEEAKAAAPYTEPGDHLPARRLHEIEDEEDA